MFPRKNLPIPTGVNKDGNFPLVLQDDMPTTLPVYQPPDKKPKRKTKHRKRGGTYRRKLHKRTSRRRIGIKRRK